MSAARMKMIGYPVHYKGLEYTVAFAGILSRTSIVSYKQVSILKRLHAGGRQTKDFLFCTLRRSRGKLLATALSTLRSPFSNVHKSYEDLQHNVVSVEIHSKSFRTMLPCYPLFVFNSPENAEEKTQRTALEFKGWISCEDAEHGDFYDRALAALVPNNARDLARLTLFN